MMPRTISASARNCNDYKAYGVLGRDTLAPGTKLGGTVKLALNGQAPPPMRR